MVLRSANCAQSPGGAGESRPGEPTAEPEPHGPRRFHGSVGRDAGRIADEVIAHLAGLVGASVKVTLQIEAEIKGGAPERLVRTVTEISRALKFTTHRFEQE